ncbi:MAG: hypothetical protein VB016_01240 [Methanomassiliicoccaceae archaeon]|nr:hypothetical protein [Methanomassiliicoccaceae archaeon]
MQNKTMALIAAAIIVVAVAGAGVYYYYGGDETQEGTKILVQDNEGVYFWIEGDGDNELTALTDACEKYDIEVVFANGWIDSLFSLGMVGPDADNNWIYWSQYSYTDGAWVLNDYNMDQYNTSDVEAMAVVYSDGSEVPAVDPDDAKVWNHSTDGTVFTIESKSGVSFKINGTGETAIEALIDATDRYAVPFVPSGNPANGVESLFGITYAYEGGQWSWWIQKVPTGDGTGWETSTLMMDEMPTSETHSMKLVYGTETM